MVLTFAGLGIVLIVAGVAYWFKGTLPGNGHVLPSSFMSVHSYPLPPRAAAVLLGILGLNFALAALLISMG